MLHNAGLAVTLRKLLERQKLHFVFQPIVDIARSTVLGYEALMRGPAGTPLERPDDLLRVAKHCGLACELEIAACKGAIREFAGLQLPGKLFLNLSAPLIAAFGREGGGELLRCAVDAGLSPARAVLRSSKIAVLPNSAPRPDMAETVGRLKVPAPTIAASACNEDLMQLFTDHPALQAVAVVDRHYPVGLVNRRNFVDKFAQRYSREIYGRRPCTLFMNPTPLRVEASAPIDSLIAVLTGDDQRYLYEGFILTEDGRYAGLATGESLVRAVTERRIEAARHANPLTFLPGNIPITEHIRRLLDAGVGFAAAYFDLNNFKPYNDLYGYWRGDEMIKLAAQLIVANVDPSQDFVGHVGGDDFVVLFQSEDWHLRCERIVHSFNRRARELFDESELARNGFESEDRRGFKAFFPLTTIAAGVVQVSDGRFLGPEEVASAAAAAKKAAKQSGSGIKVASGERAPVLMMAAG